MSMAKTNQNRKQYIPSNIDTFEKEKLYQDRIALKKQRNDTQTQNTLLKTQIKNLEIDLRKKDDMIGNLTQELKHSQAPQASMFYQPSNKFSFPGDDALN